MSREWRRLAAALRLVTRGSDPPREGGRSMPWAGILVGAAGAGVYWLAAQLWPSNIAVMLAMLSTELAPVPAPGSATPSGPMRNIGVLQVFFLIIKYNALLALSSAKLPIPVPENLTVGLLLIAGEAASRALAASRTHLSPSQLVLALVVGALPAVFLGIPGLAGLAAALGMHLVAGAWSSRRRAQPCESATAVRQASEVCFYLAALATWKYV